MGKNAIMTNAKFYRSQFIRLCNIELQPNNSHLIRIAVKVLYGNQMNQCMQPCGTLKCIFCLVPYFDDRICQNTQICHSTHTHTSYIGCICLTDGSMAFSHHSSQQRFNQNLFYGLLFASHLSKHLNDCWNGNFR